DGQWQADGFAPPNPRARQLFEAIIAAQMPVDQWPAAYPGITINKSHSSPTVYTFKRQNRLLWSLQWPSLNGQASGQATRPAAAAAVTVITLPDDSQWHLTPLSARP